jgi:hypothetical protein
MIDAEQHAVVTHSFATLTNSSKALNSVLKAHVETCSAEAEEQLATLLEQEKRPCIENHYLWDTITKIRNERLEHTIKNLTGLRGEPENVRKGDVIAMLKSDGGNDSSESQEVQDMIGSQPIGS